SEAGLNTERLYETKALNYLLSSFDLSATDRLDIPPVAITPAPFLYAVRAHHQHPDQCWIFLRNMTAHEPTLTLGDACDVRLRPHEMQVLPWHTPLACGMTLHYASSEPLWQSPHVLVLKADRPVMAEFSGAGSPPQATPDSQLHWRQSGEHWR